MNFNWDETLSIGVKNIDNQHRELFNRINLLFSSIKEGKGKDNDILNFFEEYVIKSFKEEEEIQKKNNYQKYNFQHRQHEEFKNELKELRKVFETTGISVLSVINMQQKISKLCKNYM